MKRTLWMTLALTVAFGGTVSAQTTDRQAVEAVTMRVVASLLADTSSSYHRRERLFESGTYGFRTDGKKVISVASEPRSPEAATALARMIEARIAAPEDEIRCNGGINCSGTRGVLVALGAPQIVGDSAVIFYRIHLRADNEVGLPARNTRFALILKKVAGQWCVAHPLLAGLITFDTGSPDRRVKVALCGKD